MIKQSTLLQSIEQQLSNQFDKLQNFSGEITLEIVPEKLLSVAKILRDDPLFQFEILLDVCGVDYLHYGQSEWVTENATATGFERGVVNCPASNESVAQIKSRFAVVYHLLSLHYNHRLRLRVYPNNAQLVAQDKLHELKAPPSLNSVVAIWPSANWYEREAFDLYGIFFEGHPDLRRILTDYGFKGHPFRKDFPLIGEVEVRYDATQGRVIHEPVSSVTPRTLVPKVIRHQPEEAFNDV